MPSNTTVVVGLSGGVDSAVAAWLLKAMGHQVIGLFMKNWEDDDDDAYCSSRQDWLDAAAVADLLGIDLEAVNFAAEYKERVFAEFLREYQAGRTPNPDVLCNAEIKFKAFLDHAMRLGAAWIATGHYARIRTEASSDAAGGRFYQLLKGLDRGKDQSYFLHRLSQDQLARSLFPLGALKKAQVRLVAHALGLPNAAKKDSTGICFIGERPFRAFLQRYVPSESGPIREPSGRLVGRHQGLAFYTLGQRKGLGIGGVREPGATSQALHQPWFVARKDMANNTLWVVQGHDHPWLMSEQLKAGQLSWVRQAPEAAAKAPTAIAPTPLSAKTRYRQADAPIAALSLSASASEILVRFEQAQWAVTPGQSAVIYQGEACLGGGVIEAG
ncbi:MAG: tRNA 2-thiouridine(34) synthase MnmA [Betaproteobacteria bacterium]|nr:tRNA 2-thiouridine(34) synthase MnmA [Betaproteobacteria bacterium]